MYDVFDVLCRVRRVVVIYVCIVYVMSPSDMYLYIDCVIYMIVCRVLCYVCLYDKISCMTFDCCVDGK